MSQFPNLYWSADYKTGIDRLCEQSHRSIQQTHELRQLVFNYMTYFYSNSEYLSKLSIDTLPLESTFRPYNPHLKYKAPLGSSSPFRGTRSSSNAFKRISESFRSLSLESSPKLNDILPPKSHENDDGKAELVTAGTTFELYVNSMSKESKLLMKLAAVIDREVLEKISAFIKVHESSVRKILDEYIELLGDYETTYADIEKVKSQYDELLRLQEVSAVDQQQQIKEENEHTVVEESPDSSFADKTIDDSTEDADVEDNTPSPAELDFEFPLHIGTVKVKNSSALSSLIKKLISVITITKRKIPIPGYRNEIFSSDQLCEYMMKYRPFGIDPTRLNLEKFGQALLDLKLLVGTGFLGANKFKSEGMWLEWSDLAIYVSEYEPPLPEVPSEQTPSTPKQEAHVEKAHPHTPTNKHKVPKLSIDDTNKFMNETSKRFNGMFKSVRTSLLKNNYAEQLVEVEQTYNEKYLELQRIKYYLDFEISNKTQILEKFEKAKIELIYQSLSKLSEIIYNFSLASTNSLHDLAKDFIERVNKPENYSRDFDKLIEDFTTGIYFPSIVPPSSISKKNFGSNQSNNNFQNLKRQFNLYKDFQLQIQVSTLEVERSSQFTISSIPQFLYKVIREIETRKGELKTEEEEGKSSALNELTSSWVSPINHHAYWSIKQKTIDTINEYEPSSDLDVTQESAVHKEIIDKVLETIKSSSTPELINYLKNWLLEITDSTVPYLVYDSILNLYKPDTNSDTEQSDRLSELSRILGTIPRSNLASLIFILEHIGTIFDLGTIESYETCEDIIEPLDHNVDNNHLKEVAKKLNAMDSIGAVPFVHLIFRPSVTKNASGFKPPLDVYGPLLVDLLSIEVRIRLAKTLIANEKNFKHRRENEKFGLQVKKLPNIPPPTILSEPPSTPSKNPTRTVISGIVPKSPRPLSGENFVLRPFRTKATPNPSPSSSPRHTPRNSDDINSIPDFKIRKKDILGQPSRESTPASRPRSTSSTYLTPNIDVEFEDRP